MSGDVLARLHTDPYRIQLWGMTERTVLREICAGVAMPLIEYIKFHEGKDDDLEEDVICFLSQAASHMYNHGNKYFKNKSFFEPVKDMGYQETGLSGDDPLPTSVEVGVNVKLNGRDDK